MVFNEPRLHHENEVCLELLVDSTCGVVVAFVSFAPVTSFAITAFRMVYPKRDEAHPEWLRSDYIAPVVVCVSLAIVSRLWPR
jgi:hypothetical protein